jgi:DNA-directed RNA polymerase beta' subunit
MNRRAGKELLRGNQQDHVQRLNLGEKDNMRGVSANIMFGQKPPCGTGFVDILVDEHVFLKDPSRIWRMRRWRR